MAKAAPAQSDTGSGVAAPRRSPTLDKYDLPSREWERAKELIRVFVATSAIANGRPHSLILISEPGSGKTELLDLFQPNPQLCYASDLTGFGLERILKRAKLGHVSHIVATEFQKFFLRKAVTWENTLGTLCQALEEGVGDRHIGAAPTSLHGAKLGIIGAITHDTANTKSRIFRETGFWSRVAAFEWEMAPEEMYSVMNAINRGDVSDLAPELVRLPERKITVEIPAVLGDQIRDYVYNHKQMRAREVTIMRVFVRFRALAQACAILDGRDYVHAVDVEKVFAFNNYWSRMVTGAEHQGGR